MLTLMQLLPAGWTIGHVCIAIVVLAGIIALMYIGLNRLGVSIPDWVVQVFWVLIVVVVIVLAIRLLMGLW